MSRIDPLYQVLNQLPSSGYWAPDERQRWIDAMVAVLDLCIDVHEKNDERQQP